jgi:enamine deaminase RidA (YjgF/YER057c/UK114 family)
VGVAVTKHIDGLDLDTQLRVHGYPPAPDRIVPRGLYLPAVVNAGVAYLSGIGPLDPDGDGFTHHGRIGDTLTPEDGYTAASRAAIAALRVLDRLSGLTAVNACLMLTGYLVTTEAFSDHASVLDGASAVLRDVLGSAGACARTVLGVATLPFAVPVVIGLTAAVGADSHYITEANR